jgi:hypothetical protein
VDPFFTAFAQEADRRLAAVKSEAAATALRAREDAACAVEEAERYAEERIEAAKAEAAEQIREIQSEADKRVQEERLDREIETQRRERAELVIAGLKNQVADLAGDNQALEARVAALQRQLAEQNHLFVEECRSLREKCEELEYRLADTEDERQAAVQERDNVALRLQELEIDNSWSSRRWPEHLFCGLCNRPYMEWDGTQYRCLSCHNTSTHRESII